LRIVGLNYSLEKKTRWWWWWRRRKRRKEKENIACTIRFLHRWTKVLLHHSLHLCVRI